MEGFIEAVIGDNPPEFVRIGSQYGFIRLNDGSWGVDRLFRLSDGARLSAYLSEKVGEPVQIDLNDAVSRFALEDLPEGLIARLEKHFADDYALYQSTAIGRQPNFS